MVMLKCDSCGLSREIPDKFANKTVNCPKCKKNFGFMILLSGHNGPSQIIVI